MIEDKELCDLFKVESEEHLQALESGLLHLEKKPEDSAILEEVFREAHSLKGAARMLGIEDVELLAHRLEDVLGSAHRNAEKIERHLIDPLLQAVDALRKLSSEAITGQGSGVDVAEMMEVLQNAVEQKGGSPTVEQSKDEPEPTPDPTPESVAKTDSPLPSKPRKQPKKRATIKKKPASQTALEEEEPFAKASTTKRLKETTDNQNSVSNSHASRGSDSQNPAGKTLDDYQITTIRVKTDRLDGLMSYVGELAVTRLRIGRRLADLEELSTLWDEWNSELSHQKNSLKEGGGRGQGTMSEGYGSEVKESAYFKRIGALLNEITGAAYEDAARLDSVSAELTASIQHIRLLPLRTVFDLFPRSVRDLAKAQLKDVELIIEGGETTADKRILEEIKDPIMHLIRNAIDHGIESPKEREQAGKSSKGTIAIKAYMASSNIMVEVSDDGRGLDFEAIKRVAINRKLVSQSEVEAMSSNQIQRLIFLSGLSTSGIITDVSGRGVGLDVVSNNIERLKGIIEVVEQAPGLGCTFRIRLPLTLATTSVLIVREGENFYAIPDEFIENMRLIEACDIFSIDGQSAILFNKQSVSVVRLANILELPELISQNQQKNNSAGEKRVSCVLLNVADEQVGLLVDELIDEQEVVLKQHSKLLKRVRNVSGSTILGTGQVCTVLNPHDLVKSVQQSKNTVLATQATDEIDISKMVLLAEDSIITRTQEKRILENAGYQVVTAVDGLDALNKLNEHEFSAIVSDIQMPNMDGLTLAAKIRSFTKYKEIPIVLVTALSSEEDRQRGLEAGANAYIGKPAFDQRTLLDTLQRLIV